MSTLQICVGASNTSMVRKVMPFIRRVSGRNSVEKGTEKYLYARDKKLTDYFSFTIQQFEGDPSARLSPVVFCNDVNRLINDVCDMRMHPACVLRFLLARNFTYLRFNHVRKMHIIFKNNMN